VPDFKRYFEPFVGGGALFFRLVSTREMDACISDANADLINTYKIVKGRVKELIDLLQTFEGDYKKEPHGFYYRLRSSNSRDSVERAARFIALNKTCYNGLYRVNSKGVFNVPLGRYKNPRICDADQLQKASIALACCKQMLVGDYKNILKKARAGDFVYLDPPFSPLSDTADFTSYTSGGFGMQDQIDLAKVFADLDKHGCKVLLSNSDTKFTRELYSDFSIKSVAVQRAISCKGNSRTGYRELLVRNYENACQP
jgi:DNA adenine methylase